MSAQFTPDPTIAAEVDRQKTALLYRSAGAAQLTNIVNASLLAYVGTQNHTPVLPALIWWGVIVAIASGRYLLARRFRAARPDAGASRTWQRRYVAATALAAGAWGMGAVLFMWQAPSEMFLFTGIVLSGMVAGAVPILAPVQAAFRTFALVIVTPMLALIFLQASSALHWAFAIMALLFMAIVLMSARYLHETLDASLRLGLEKDRLAERAEAARQVAESALVERREAEAALIKSESRYRLLVENSPAGIFQYSSDLIVTYCNARMAAILRAPVGQIVGMDLKQLRDQRVLPALRAALAGQNGKYEGAYVSTLSQADLWLTISCSPLNDPGDPRPSGIAIVEDITETRALQDDLRVRMQELGTILDNSSVGITYVKGRRQVWANRSMAETFGYTLDEMANQPTRMFYLTQEDYDAFGRQAYPVLARGEQYKAELEMRRRDGTAVWMRVSGKSLDVTQPNAGSIWVLEDISDQKQMEFALKESEARYRSLYLDTPAIMHSIDAEGRIIHVSNLWLETLGYARDEVIGRRSTDFLTEASRRYANETVLPEFFRTGEVHDIRYQFVTKSGQVLDVLLSAISDRDADNRVIRSLAVMTDVTERDRAHRALTDAKDYADNLIQTANVMIVELDALGHLKRLNPAAEAVTGYTLAELRGRSWFETIVPRARYPEVWHEFERILATGNDVQEFENPIVTRSGEVRHILWRNSQIVEGGAVTGTLSFGIDVTENKRMQERLAQNEAILRDAQSIAHIGNWTYDAASQAWSWSDEFYRILGLSPAETPPSLQAFMNVVHEDDRDAVRETYRRFIDTRQSDEITFQLVMRDGEIKYVRQQFAALAGQDGQSPRLFGVLQDATLEILQEMGLKESEERFRTIANYTYDWEYWQGPEKEILFMSPSCERISGYLATDFIRNHDLLREIVHPDDRPAWESHICSISDEHYGQLSFRIVRKDGEVRWIAHGCQAVYSRDGKFRGRRSSNRDITELKQAEELAHQLAYYDSLTNLPNRRMLMDRMGIALTQARRYGRAMAVMFLDLDRFKQVNDTLGHDVGDKLLAEVAARLTQCVRQGDTVARAGGDEFIVVLPEIAHPADARMVAEKIIHALHEPVVIDGDTVKTSTSIGIAIHTADGADDAEGLIQKADLAMYEAKRTGRNCYRVFG